MHLFRLLFLTNCLVLAVTASAQTITCSSNDMGRHYCQANTSNGVKLVYQRSGSACTMGFSWGYNNGGIWVDHGCRADFAVSGGTGQGGYQGDPNNALLMCKNTASQRLPGVPLAYISVYRGTDPDSNNYMINFRAQPPNQRQSSGFCIVSRNGQLRNFQFDNNSGGGNNNGGNNGGGNNGGASPNTALQLCKDIASSRLPNVPRAYIAVYRGTDTGSGSYMINFRAQPPNQRQSSGFCIVSRNGQLQSFQFDPGSGGNQGGGNQGGNGGGNNGGGNNGAQTSQDVMIACKNAVSARMPNVPLAYIQVNQPRVNGGSMLSNFRVQPPSGPYASGSCDVFKNGRVNLQFNN
jgi:hypothetical protein